MARTHARILTRIWDSDSDFWHRPLEEQWTFFTLLSQKDVSTCGVLAHNPKRIARLAPGLSVARVKKAVANLETAGYVVVDHDTDELCFRTFLRNDGVLQSPNILKGAARSFDRIYSPTIRRAVIDQLPPAIRAIWPETILTTDPKEIAARLARKPQDKATPEPSPHGSGDFPYPLSLSPDPSSSSPPPEPSAPAPRHTQPAEPEEAAAAAEEEDPRIRQACDHLARRALANREGPAVTNRRGWLTRVANERWADHADHAAQILDCDPDLTAEQLADHLEPDADHPPDGQFDDADTLTDTPEELEVRRRQAEAVANPAGQAARDEIRAKIHALKGGR